MKRIVDLYPYLALAILAVMVGGCAGGLGGIVPLSAKIQNADRKFEQAAGVRIESDNKEMMQKDLAKQKALYDAALTDYLGIIKEDPQGKYAQRAHFQAAEIYTRRYEWDKATEHYQAIIDLSPAGYYAASAKSSIADIRKNRQLIEEKLRVYRNRIDTEDSQNAAAQALYDIAQAYERLENYPEAIRYYKKLVDEFPKYKLSSQAQFQIGNIYFYKLYDYSNTGGWGAFVDVTKKFSDSYEAKQAATLLKQTKDILTEIAQDQADIQKYTNKKALEYVKAGRYVPSNELWVMGYDDRIVQDFQNIARAWEQLKNYPYAIIAYRELADKLSYKKFATADALYQIGRLYQQNGQYEHAIDAYADLFEKAPESSWRNDAVYQQAICYRAIREFTQAYDTFKAYMSLGTDAKYYRDAEQIVRQMELDQDNDGYPLYQEQEAGTSDQDPNSHPGAKA